jgi:hypothetical protein
VLSRSSLKTKLIAFRDSLRPPREEFGPWLVGVDCVTAPDEKGRLVGNRNSADLQLLDRWLARCERENLDEKLKNLREAPELIRLVLTARWKAGATVTQIYGVKWKTPSSAGEVVGLDRKWRELKDELTNNISLSNLEILVRAYFLHSDYADLVGEFNEEPRQRDTGGQTRLKRLFWDFVQSYLYIRFGKWFDNEVAILTEIAFSLPDYSVSPQQINHARRQR